MKNNLGHSEAHLKEMMPLTQHCYMIELIIYVCSPYNLQGTMVMLYAQEVPRELASMKYDWAFFISP